MSNLYRVRPDERAAGQLTPGIARETAIESDRMWAGCAITEAGTASGWHHHGDFETAIYVLTGGLRMEFGASGSESFDASPGDFVYVGKGAVHRESNPTEEVGTFVVVRSGEGDLVVNVDGPE
jgi:uncharacterized RmlC-like cupin family protein